MKLALQKLTVNREPHIGADDVEILRLAVFASLNHGLRKFVNAAQKPVVFDEAIAHINKYSSAHTEAIVTENYTNAMRFLREVDSASVMVNASTRFADGFEYGLGAEIGISNDKLHARGPVGLEGLTSLKYLVLGHGEVRV